MNSDPTIKPKFPIFQRHWYANDRGEKTILRYVTRILFDDGRGKVFYNTGPGTAEEQTSLDEFMLWTDRLAPVERNQDEL